MMLIDGLIDIKANSIMIDFMNAWILVEYVLFIIWNYYKQNSTILENSRKWRGLWKILGTFKVWINVSIESINKERLHHHLLKV